MHILKYIQHLSNQIKIIVLAIVLVLLSVWYIAFSPNTAFNTQVYDLYLKEGENHIEVISQLKEEGVVYAGWTFRITATFMNFNKRHKKGLFEIPKRASNYRIIKLLKKQQKKSVLVPIGAYRFRKYLIKGLTNKLDIKEKAVRFLLQDKDFVERLDPELTTESVYSIFINDTIPVYKDVRKDELIKRIYRNYQKFWTKERIKQAEKIGLTQNEVIIMASIVMAETLKEDEMPKIAGLYLNRLRDGMRLQSDPTILYAVGQKPLRRILNSHTKINHPYNTYRKNGLPPGPVFTPSVAAIDAVLNYEDHDYYFFCAMPGDTGYHTFCRTYDEHKEIAKKYRQETYRKKK